MIHFTSQHLCFVFQTWIWLRLLGPPGGLALSGVGLLQGAGQTVALGPGTDSRLPWWVLHTSRHIASLTEADSGACQTRSWGASQQT